MRQINDPTIFLHCNATFHFKRIHILNKICIFPMDRRVYLHFKTQKKLQFNTHTVDMESKGKIESDQFRTGLNTV